MRLFAGLVCAVLLLLPLPLLGQADKPFLPAHLEPITASNVAGLQEVGHIGDGSIDQISLSPDGRYLAVINRLGIFIHDLEHPEQTPRVLAAEYQPIINARFSPSWAQVVVSGSQMVMMDVATGKAIQVLDATGGIHHTANEIVFSHSGRYLALSTGMDSGFVHIWDRETGKKVYEDEYRYGLFGLVFGPKDETLAYATAEPDIDGRIEDIWIAANNAPWKRVDLPDEDKFGAFKVSWIFYEKYTGPFNPETHRVQANADGSLLVSEQIGKNYRVWDSLTGRELRPLPAGTEFERFNPSGALLVYNKTDHTIRLHSAMTGLEQTVATAAPDHYTDFSADGKTLVIVEGNQARLLNLGTKTERNILLGNYLGNISAMAFSQDGQTLYFLADAKSLWQLDMVNGTLTPIGQQDGLSGAFAFNPAISTLALGGEDGSIYLWDVQAKKRERTLHEHEKGITALVFSPEGQTLASSSEDMTVRLWDVKAGTSTLFNRYDQATIDDLAFSPDGKILGALDGDNGKGAIFYRLPDKMPFARLFFSDSWIHKSILSFSLTGQRVAVGGGNLRIMHINQLPKDEAPSQSYALGLETGTPISFNPSSDLVFSSDTDAYIKVNNSFQAWNVDTQTSVFQQDLPVAPYTALAFSLDGRVMAAAGYEGVIHFWGVPGS
jgi:WD40 repeat protein